MKLIVGLGNIGKQYENNRHNTGFMAIDFLAEDLKISLDKNKFNGEFYKGDDFIIGKPHTYMNLSGDFVNDLAKFYKVDTDDILIVYDDMDLALGKIRLRAKGTSGGQNGMNDVMLKLQTQEVKRLKIGVGRPENYVTNYLLSDFTKEQFDVILSKKEEIVKLMKQFLEGTLSFT